MTRTTRRLLVALTLAAGAAPLAGTAAAQQAPAPTPLVVTAVNRTAALEAQQGARRAAERARRGDLVRYELAFTNPGATRVRGVKLENPIPGGLHFVGGSAVSSRDDARAEYSADGGRTYSRRPMETVTVDGKAVTRPVAPERYTHVRWTLAGWVQPGATVTAAYEARLAGATRPPIPAKQ